MEERYHLTGVLLNRDDMSINQLIALPRCTTSRLELKKGETRLG
jgi:hypothetical protein